MAAMSGTVQKPPGLPRHMSWSAGKANKETILEKIGLMRGAKSPGAARRAANARNLSFLTQKLANGSSSIYQNVPIKKKPQNGHQHHHKKQLHPGPRQIGVPVRPAPAPPALRSPQDAKLPPLPPGTRPRSPGPLGRVNGMLLTHKPEPESVLSCASSSWSDDESTFSSTADSAIEPEEEVYVDCTSSTIYLGNYRGSCGSEIDAYSSYYSTGSYKGLQDCAKKHPSGFHAALRVKYFHEGWDREDQELTICFGEEKEGGDEASGEDESSTEEGDHTYESLYDVIGSSNRLDRVSQPGVDNDVVVDGEDVSFDDELFDDSFDSASDDENAKGGTLTKASEEAYEAELAALETSRSQKSISAGQKIRKKLRRNWSLTKSDIKEGINRIRKKSTSAGPIPPFSTFSSTSELDQNQESPANGRDARGVNRVSAPVGVPKKTNWSLKSHFKKKSMSATSLKNGTSDRKETSMFYLTLSIKSDDKEESNLATTNATARASCPSLPENVEPPRRRRSDADSESARSNSSGANDTGIYRIQSPSGDSNSSSSCYGSSGGSNASVGMPRPHSKSRPTNRLSSQSIARPKIAPPDPPTGASPRRSVENSWSAESSGGGSTRELISVRKSPSPSASENVDQQKAPLSETKRRFSSTESEPQSQNDRRLSFVGSHPCHRYSADDATTQPPLSSVSSVSSASLVAAANRKMQNKEGSRHGPTQRPPAPPFGVRFVDPPPQPPPSPVKYDRPPPFANRNEVSSEPPPLPPVPPTLRGRPVVKKPPTAPAPVPQKTRGFKQQDVVEDSHYMSPTGIFAGFEEDSYVSAQLADEPLYQFYTATVHERATQYQGQTSCGEDDYEVIDEDDDLEPYVPKSGRLLHEEVEPCTASGVRIPRGVVLRSKKNDDLAEKEIRRMSTLAALELAGPRSPHRTLWCELPQVQESGVLDTMSVQEKKLQEAIFEVITSEASYLKSLNILVRHFMQCPRFSDDSQPECVLSRRDRDVLFSDILPVRDVSEALLCDLEKRWAENIVIEDISDIILAHAQDHFGVYVKYCSNKIHQDRLLNNLKETSPQFCEVLRELETDPVCQSLSMHSFLMLPMQRITRLPLLIDAIFHRHPPSSEEYENCKNALTVLNKVVHECNEGARKMERLEELLVLSRQLDFGTGVKALPLMSASRWLVKRGQLTRLLWKESDTMKRAGGLGRNRPHKQPLHLFLFTDVLIITKKKGEEQGYTVLDYCSRNMIQIQEEFDETMLPGKLPDGINKAHVMLVTLLENREGKTVEMVLACPGDSERARWTEAVTPRRSSDPNEVIYEEWDCPQVQAIHPYTAQQPDELSLETSDVVNVFKKTADGWYQGERIRDGERGWFPGNFCEEIASAHVRARNLRQRYRLLVLSGSYLEEKRRVSVGKAAMFYVPLAADAAVATTTTTTTAATAVGNNNNNNNKRRERKSASSVFAPAM